MKVILGGSSMAQCVAALLGVLQTNFGVAECDITMIQANTAAHTNTADDRVEIFSISIFAVAKIKRCLIAEHYKAFAGHC